VGIPVPTSPRCGYDEAKPTNCVLHRLPIACYIAHQLRVTSTNCVLHRLPIACYAYQLRVTPTNCVLHRLLTACRIAYALTILYAFHIHYALLYTLCTPYTLTACHIAASAGSQHSEFSSISARKSRRRFCIRLCCSFCLFAVARLRALAFSICFVKPGVCTRCARAAFAPLPWCVVVVVVV
jgi:hypothetical protein